MLILSSLPSKPAQDCSSDPTFRRLRHAWEEAKTAHGKNPPFYTCSDLESECDGVGNYPGYITPDQQPVLPQL